MKLRICADMPDSTVKRFVDNGDYLYKGFLVKSYTTYVSCLISGRYIKFFCDSSFLVGPKTSSRSIKLHFVNSLRTAPNELGGITIPVSVSLKSTYFHFVPNGLVVACVNYLKQENTRNI